MGAAILSTLADNRVAAGMALPENPYLRRAAPGVVEAAGSQEPSPDFQPKPTPPASVDVE